MTLYFGLIGHPVAHSRSPEIHRAFGRQFGREVRYDLLDTEPAQIMSRLHGLRALGLQGCNVTVPFKEDIFRTLNEATERGRRARAINTLLPGSGEAHGWLGDNTDGAGFMQDLQHSLQLDPSGSDVLILGAGGAVRGILGPLLDARPANVFIANRTPSRAATLREAFSEQADTTGTALGAGGYDQVPGQAFGLIVNGTSASLGADLPAIPATTVSRKTTAYDLMYAPDPTVFMRWAHQSGAAQSVDGLGMLVGQAAESFYLWTGFYPDIVPVKKALRRGP